MVLNHIIIFNHFDFFVFWWGFCFLLSSVLGPVAAALEPTWEDLVFLVADLEAPVLFWALSFS